VNSTNWALPIANHLCNNILTHWAWQDRPDQGNVDPSILARWLGTYVGITPNRARDFLELYAHHHEWDVYYSHMAQNTQTWAQTKRDWKTLMASMEEPPPHLPWESLALPHPHTQSG